MLRQNVEDARDSLRRYPHPQDVVVETSAYCNLKCIMCPQKDLTRARGMMSPTLFSRIVKEIAWKGWATRLWVAIMGEPLLHPEIAAMIASATRHGIPVCLNTNAALLTEDVARALIAARVTEVYVGVDAVTDETYRKIRVGGDYQTVVDNTLRFAGLCRGRVRLLCQFIEMAENCHETEAFKAFWLSKGVEVKLRPRLGWGLGVDADNLVVPAAERFPCPWLIRTMSIHWDGTIAQCDGDYDGKYTVGNLKDMSIEQAWDGPLAQRRDRHWAKDFTYPSCVHCKDWQAGRSYYYAPEKAK